MTNFIPIFVLNVIVSEAAIQPIDIWAPAFAAKTPDACNSAIGVMVEKYGPRIGPEPPIEPIDIWAPAIAAKTPDACNAAIDDMVEKFGTYIASLPKVKKRRKTWLNIFAVGALIPLGLTIAGVEMSTALAAGVASAGSIASGGSVKMQFGTTGLSFEIRDRTGGMLNWELTAYEIDNFHDTISGSLLDGHEASDIEFLQSIVDVFSLPSYYPQTDTPIPGIDSTSEFTRWDVDEKTQRFHKGTVGWAINRVNALFILAGTFFDDSGARGLRELISQKEHLLRKTDWAAHKEFQEAEVAMRKKHMNDGGYGNCPTDLVAKIEDINFRTFLSMLFASLPTKEEIRITKDELKQALGKLKQKLQSSLKLGGPTQTSESSR